MLKLLDTLVLRILRAGEDGTLSQFGNTIPFSHTVYLCLCHPRALSSESPSLPPLSRDHWSAYTLFMLKQNVHGVGSRFRYINERLNGHVNGLIAQDAIDDDVSSSESVTAIIEKRGENHLYI